DPDRPRQAVGAAGRAPEVPPGLAAVQVAARLLRAVRPGRSVPRDAAQPGGRAAPGAPAGPGPSCAPAGPGSAAVSTATADRRGRTDQAFVADLAASDGTCLAVGALLGWLGLSVVKPALR